MVEWLRNFRDPTGQLARWLKQLQKYTSSTVHQQGKHHGNADALSRLPCHQCGLQEPNPEPPDLVAVNRVSLLCGHSLDDLHEAQFEGAVVGPILCAKQTDHNL